MAKNFHYHNLIIDPQRSSSLEMAMQTHPSLVERARTEVNSWHHPLSSSGDYKEDMDAFVRRLYPDLFENGQRVRGYFRIKSITLRLDGRNKQMHYSEVRGDGVSVRSITPCMASIRTLDWLAKSYLLPWAQWENQSLLAQLAGTWFSGEGFIIRIDFTKRDIRVERHWGISK